MERVIEDLHQWEKEFHTSNIYATTGNFTEFVFTLGDVKEEENKYQTDGPEKATKAKFVLTEKLDKNASLKVYFSVNGSSRLDQSPTIQISMDAKLHIEFPNEDGPAYTTFITFYLSHIRPKIKDVAEHSFDVLFEKITNYLKKEFTIKEIE